MSGIQMLIAPVFFLIISLVSQPCLAQKEAKAAEPAKEAKADPDEDQDPKQEQESEPTGPERTWELLVPEDGGFSIELPGTPKHARRKLKPLPEVEVDVNMYLLAIEGGKVAVVVGYHDVQELPTTDEKRREILDGGIKGTIVNVLGKLKSHERGEFEGNKMRDFSYQGVRGQRDIAGVSKLILVDQRVFQLSIIHLADTSVDEELQKRFFSSFKLVK